MDTNYFEDELWKFESIEIEARAVLHNMHVSTNQTRGSRINFESASRPSCSSLDSIESKLNNTEDTFFIE